MIPVKAGKIIAPKNRRPQIIPITALKLDMYGTGKAQAIANPPHNMQTGNANFDLIPPAFAITGPLSTAPIIGAVIEVAAKYTVTSEGLASKTF